MSISLYAQPIITSISPATGPIAGGTNVTITGSGFTDTTDVYFGPTLALNAIVNSDTSITATTDLAVPGVNHVSVVTVSGTSTPVREDLFTFQGNWICYVPQSGTPSNLLPVNIPANTLGSLISTGANSTPKGISFTPDGRFVLVTNSTAGNISIIDLAFQTVTLVTVGSNPVSVAVTPNGQKAYVVNASSNNVSVIDLTTTPVVITTISTDVLPQDVAITPDGLKAYVINATGNSITVIDTVLDTVLTTITGVGTRPSSIAVTPDGAKLYVTCFQSSDVYVINTVTDSIIGAPISIGGRPFDVAIQPNGVNAYVSSSFANMIAVIDLSTDTVINTIVYEDPAPANAITPDSLTDYTGSSKFFAIIPIDLTTNTLGALITGFLTPLNQQIAPDQAPLASFEVTLALAGSPSTFDGSLSVSPVGTIATYDWDFGDGNTLSTTSSVVDHTYATSGTFTVTLTVTNSGGTSTATTFTGQLISNHGDDTFPVLSKSITVLSPNPPPPSTVEAPSHFHGRIKRHFHHKKPFFSLHTWWKKSLSSDVISYQVFGDNKLLATIKSAKKLHFKKLLYPKKSFFQGIHDYKKFLHKKYKVRAVSATGAKSSFVYLKVKFKH